MKRDEAEKLIESVADWSRAYQHALDQWPEKEAVACESELKIAKAKLLAALAPEQNQPEEAGTYKLTAIVEVNPGGMVSIGDNDWYSVESITGHWEKVGE